LYKIASRSQLDENQIQKWLTHKFPHGFSDLENALERLDLKQMGTVNILFYFIFYLKKTKQHFKFYSYPVIDFLKN
jgi:hypothetical protein